MRKLSHLAYIALGVVADEQPCSGYAVMRAFKNSSSTYFSGSAGAIYPLLRRLESLGLVKAERSKSGSRTKRSYALTEKGSKALEAWVAGPVPLDELSFLVDLLRTRVLFFEKLTKPQRRKFVKDCRTKLAARIKETQARSAKPCRTKYDEVTMQSIVMVDQARIAWLDIVERELC